MMLAGTQLKGRLSKRRLLDSINCLLTLVLSIVQLSPAVELAAHTLFTMGGTNLEGKNAIQLNRFLIE